ncbi:hypothetical protein L484_020441 [Morus notabilis]|uniref:Uncharacterized protein n=1 Tax=Morus notabilis TaxID=981085 RepID=W9SBN2_9ROSA|nr:uncharacterized protein LOC21403339 [Morus notabilis]EXC34672.1 hypothetical protein L484_020441 [Morus notabilis]
MEATSTDTDKNVVDVSSFFLFEATGDSESCSKTNPDERVSDLDDDDAESCSWDSTDRCPSNGDSMDSVDAIDRNCSNDDEDDECDRDEEEEGSDPVQRRTWSGSGERRKSNVSVDSTTKSFESLNEMEKNRLFWETCLAS